MRCQLLEEPVEAAAVVAETLGDVGTAVETEGAEGEVAPAMARGALPVGARKTSSSTAGLRALADNRAPPVHGVDEGRCMATAHRAVLEEPGTRGELN